MKSFIRGIKNISQGNLYRPDSRYSDRTFLAGRFEPVLTVTSLLGSIYMNALNMMIFPLVFCSIIMGITSIGNAVHRKDYRLFHDLFPVYHRTCQSGRTDHPTSDPPWKGVNFEMATSDIQATEMTSILDTVKT